MTSEAYSFNRETRCWVRPGHQTINYSDGDAVENRLLTILRYCKDVASDSEELRLNIVDWPSEYHLSPARHNLLRPFAFRPTDRILELGCGCGAMTRYLGESGATVVAVEGSLRRAAIAAERCRDLTNVRVYCDSLEYFECAEKFDVVTLIGVLEYAPKFIKHEDPVEYCLRQARSFLKEGGTLMLAIENQLGLKYLNGCPEDHVGIPFYGVNDLYGGSAQVTFGRHALSEILGSAGLPWQEFFYPFPDYKLPMLILSDGALDFPFLNVADLLVHATGRSYPETRYRAFAENLAWRTVIRNRLLPDLTNSFLVLARHVKTVHHPIDWLAKMYSRDSRRTSYQIESTIVSDATGDLTVRKRKLFPDSPGLANPWLQHAVIDCAYLVGHLLVGRIHEAMAREAGIDELAACFSPWLDFLLAHVKTNETGERTLPEHFIDCIPSNLIELPSGEMRYFDAEWISATPIPLTWVIVRGILGSLSGCLESRQLANLTYRQLIDRVVQVNGLHISETEYAVASHLEERLVSQCLIGGLRKATQAEIIGTPIAVMFRLSHNVLEKRFEFIQMKNELTRVKGSVSWRITSPLRISWNLLRKLVIFAARSLNAFKTRRND
ncbi:MAG: class I SAM-dependent methyltransferase [Gallionellaceae bacterium]|nr:class I SAM-dependent methyltransferase [Gallionellaceae bacterium]